MTSNQKVGTISLVFAVIIITATVVRTFTVGSILSEYSERIETKRHYLIEQRKLGNIGNVEEASKDLIANLCMCSEIQSAFLGDGYYREGFAKLFVAVLIGLLCMLPLGVSVQRQFPSERGDRPK